MPKPFSYAMVEAALVETHGIATAGVPALRSRFGAFQRGGLLGKQPGRGGRLQYGPDELHRVVFAFEMTQAGMSPTTVRWLVSEFWGTHLRDIFIKAERASVHEKPDVVLFMIGLRAMDGPEKSVPNINHTTMDKLSGSLLLGIRGKDEFDDLPARALVVNLSAQLRRFQRALTHYHLSPAMLAGLEDEPKRKRAAKPKRRIKSPIPLT
jgi:hypothetical protein